MEGLHIVTLLRTCQQILAEWPAWLFRAGDLPPTRVARFPGEIGELLGDAMSARSNFIDI